MSIGLALIVRNTGEVRSQETYPDLTFRSRGKKKKAKMFPHPCSDVHVPDVGGGAGKVCFVYHGFCV